jgi:hypothetical protein
MTSPRHARLARKSGLTTAPKHGAEAWRVRARTWETTTLSCEIAAILRETK